MIDACEPCAIGAVIVCYALAAAIGAGLAVLVLG